MNVYCQRRWSKTTKAPPLSSSVALSLLRNRRAFNDHYCSFENSIIDDASEPTIKTQTTIVVHEPPRRKGEGRRRMRAKREPRTR